MEKDSGSKQELLAKAVWNYRDVMIWDGCNKDKAYRLIERAQNDFNGCVPYGSGYAKTDSILAIYGTSVLEQRRNYGLL